MTYITVQSLPDGHRVLAHRTPVAALQVCITPHRDVAHGIKRDLGAVIERAVAETLKEHVDLETIVRRAVADALREYALDAIIERAVKDAMKMQQLELL